MKTPSKNTGRPERHARYRERHRTEIAARMRERRAKDPEAAKAYWRQWYESHPGYFRLRNIARRARLASAYGSFTEAEWQLKLAEHGHHCFYCGASGPLQADHMVPISRGGSNEISNIVPACKSCNARKGTKTTEEFLQRRAC